MKLDLERFEEYDDKYEYVDELYNEASTIPIRLTDEKYYGTILKYDTIKVQGVDDDDMATLKFNFNFIENPHEVDENDNAFNTHIGDLLVNIIINTLNGNDNEARNNNLESISL
jgi:hypothetical protein|tara:strand:- start:2490 stop:2831 length:342 start_codon:yes stop_codon:yes gene_type:complete